MVPITVFMNDSTMFRHQSNDSQGPFKTMRSTMDAEVRKAKAKMERSGKGKDSTLRYKAKDIKAFMEKRTSLW